MAPIKKKASTRTSAVLRARTRLNRASITPSNTKDTPSQDDTFTAFSTTKKDKMRMRRSAFVSRIEKSVAPTRKRRRPNNKLKAEMSGLLDVLPDVDNLHDEESSATTSKPHAPVDSTSPNTLHSQMRLTSVKSRPGAQKKKVKLDNIERERFAQNLAQLNQPSSVTDNQRTPDTTTQSNNKWSALRAFISQTMEQSSAFPK